MDSILKEISDHINTNKEESCRPISSNIHNHWIEINVKNDCVCMDDKFAIPNSKEDAYIEAI